MGFKKEFRDSAAALSRDGYHSTGMLPPQVLCLICVITKDVSLLEVQSPFFLLLLQDTIVFFSPIPSVYHLEEEIKIANAYLLLTMSWAIF